ncbi:MAG: glycosyltransferase [Actinomycetota bacterium]|nr:glycosyltransferase [Actinomycetota bacterium]
MDIFLLYQYAITGILLFMLFNFLVNNFVFKDTSRYKLPQDILDKNPLVSVLIPARNEEANIKRCLLSLTKQDYTNIEILVLDDSSTDSTAEIVKGLSKKDKRIRLYHGKKLKKGWMGKPYACHQLAGYASGDYLIFTDADTLHFPGSVSGAVASLLRNKLGGLSVFSKEIMVTIHERMMVPFGVYMILCFMPLFLVKKAKSALFCTAIGQFMLFKRDVYEKIGGHESVKSEVLEDIKISKRVKRAGYKFMIFDGRNNLYCRSYRSFREVIRGYSKVLFAAFDYRLPIISVIIVLASAVLLFPFLWLVPAIIFKWPMIVIELMVLQAAIILATRIVFSIRFRSRAIDILLHPFSVIYLVLIAINSVFNTIAGTGVNWKGRVYDISHEDSLTLIDDSYKQKL